MHKPLSKKQIKDLNQKISSQVKPVDIIFVLQDVIDPINVGSIFRTADGLDASLILTGQTLKPPHKQISLASRGLDRSVKWEYLEDFSESIKNLKLIGYEIVGLELSENAILYSDYNFSRKVVIVLGSEAHGIYKKNLELLDAVVAIPMLGRGPSLNVNIAAAILGYKILQG